MQEKNSQNEHLIYVEFEEYILGTILSYPLSISSIHNFTSIVFSDKLNRTIAEVIENLLKNNTAINILNVAGELIKYDIVDKNSILSILTTMSSKCQPDGVFKQYSLIAEYYMRRKVIEDCNKIITQASNLENDIFSVISKASENIKAINSFGAIGSSKSYSELLKERLNNASEVQSNKESYIYSTGDENFDYYFGFNPNEIMFISGESGAAKTKFTLRKIFQLLENNHKKVSIYWNVFEDPQDDIIDMYLSSKIFATKKEIQGKAKNRISKLQLSKMEEIIEKIACFDIVFNEEKLTVPEIRKRFIGFCNKRPERYCICVIDNVMLLRENSLKNIEQTKIDDLISRELKDTLDATRLITKSSLVLLHHFNSDYANKNNLRYGYRPSKNSMKGSTRYHDIANLVLSINYPKLHPDLVNCYPNEKDVLNSLYILSSEKSRSDEGTVIRYFADLDYNIFSDVEFIK